jgi:hypothetical protein
MGETDGFFGIGNNTGEVMEKFRPSSSRRSFMETRDLGLYLKHADSCANIRFTLCMKLLLGVLATSLSTPNLLYVSE